MGRWLSRVTEFGQVLQQGSSSYDHDITTNVTISLYLHRASASHPSSTISLPTWSYYPTSPSPSPSPSSTSALSSSSSNPPPLPHNRPNCRPPHPLLHPQTPIAPHHISPTLHPPTFLSLNDLIDDSNMYFTGTRILTYQLLHAPSTRSTHNIPSLIIVTPVENRAFVR